MFAEIEGRAASGEPLALRNLALLELLYGSGLRATELVSLPRRAFRPGQPFLILRGKGDKERLAPVSERAAEAVRQWLPHVPENSHWLFPSGRSHLSRVRLFQLVRSMAALAVRSGCPARSPAARPRRRQPPSEFLARAPASAMS